MRGTPERAAPGVYCASRSRYFWGLRLHLLCTLHGLPVSFALTDATADERQTLLSILDDPALTARRAGQVIIADKNYYGHDFEADLAAAGLVLLRPARKGEPERRGRQYFKPLRRILALTAAIWHSDHASQPIMRSLIAYDH